MFILSDSIITIKGLGCLSLSLLTYYHPDVTIWIVWAGVCFRKGFETFEKGGDKFSAW